MSTIIQSAVEGQRKAMKYLYDSNKKKICYIAQNLLENRTQAEKAVIAVFKHVFEGIKEAGIETEKEFTDLLVKKTINYCKKKNSADNASKEMSKPDSSFYDKLIASFDENAKKVIIADVVDEKVGEIIDEISKPYESKKRIRNIFMGAAGLAICVCIIACIMQFTKMGNKTSGSDEAGNGVVTVELDKSLTYYADITIQDYGTITIKLEDESAPITVTNFVSLAQSGFYDGLTFHRIIENFVMQGGDPVGDGTGGSENTIVGEFSANGYDNNLSHTRGAVSMARSSISYDSARSQFFIVHKDCSASLDGKYAVFGYVTEGMEIVDSICEEAEPVDDNGLVATDKQPVITSIKIRTE